MGGARSIRYIVLAGVILALSGILLAQSGSKALVVNGKTWSAAIRQIDGHSYIDLETVAEILNGVVTVEPNRIVLTTPTSSANTAAAASSNSVPPPSPPGLSRDFSGTAISALAEMREWRGAVATMITYGLAVSAGWSQDYRNRVEAIVTQASVAATTDADRNAMQLLRAEFDKQSDWADGVISARRTLDGSKTVDPNALANDPVLAKITNCGRFMNTMLVSGAFGDDASCH